jgi:phosphoserine phosphatase RsbU/P
MLRVYLVDDEPPARARMRQLLSEELDVIVVGESGDAVEARDAIAATRPDIVFLDIDMPEISGTSLARTLPEPKPLVVFATAFERYAVEAFSVEAADYLLKPITRPRLAATLARIRERLARRTELERELRAASAAQALLLPRRFDGIPGYDAAALTLPARGVGGDFLIAQRLPTGAVVLALGDVEGKGMPAGLVASGVQARLETMAQHGSGGAEQVVAQVNRMLCAQSEGTRFATLVYLELHPNRPDVVVVNAGHPPALLIEGGTVVRRVASAGPALGLLPEARFSAEHVAIGPAATLLVYSDGVTEATDEHDVEFGEDHLVKAVASAASPTAATLCHVVIDAVRQHAGNVAGDDITVLAVRRES